MAHADNLVGIREDAAGYWKRMNDQPMPTLFGGFMEARIINDTLKEIMPHALLHEEKAPDREGVRTIELSIGGKLQTVERKTTIPGADLAVPVAAANFSSFSGSTPSFWRELLARAPAQSEVYERAIDARKAAAETLCRQTVDELHRLGLPAMAVDWPVRIYSREEVLGEMKQMNLPAPLVDLAAKDYSHDTIVAEMKQLQLPAETVGRVSGLMTDSFRQYSVALPSVLRQAPRTEPLPGAPELAGEVPNFEQQVLFLAYMLHKGFVTGQDIPPGTPSNHASPFSHNMLKLAQLPQTQNQIRAVLGGPPLDVPEKPMSLHHQNTVREELGISPIKKATHTSRAKTGRLVRETKEIEGGSPPPIER